MDWRAMHGPMNWGAMDWRAMDGTIRTAAARPAALDAALVNLSQQNHAVVHVRGPAGSADHFDRLGLGQSDPAQRHNDDRAPDETQPLHGFFPALPGQAEPGRLWNLLGLAVTGLAREFGAASSGEHHLC